MTSEIHSLLASENNCEVLKAGEICLEHEKYRAAEILFLACYNYSKLALVSMYMGDLKKAIKYGDSANSQSVWYDICIECIEKKEIQGIEYASGKLFASNYKVSFYLLSICQLKKYYSYPNTSLFNYNKSYIFFDFCL